MSLDVWFKDDIRKTLAAIEFANAAGCAGPAAEPDERHNLRQYRNGFQDALRAVATAFGLAIPESPLNPLHDKLRLPRDWKEVEYDDLSADLSL